MLMSLTYGFYNSVGGDRSYNASQFGELFNGLIRDGVFSSIGTSMFVLSDNDGVKVGIGRAWFNGTWTNVDAPLRVNTNDTGFTWLTDAYQAIVLEVNTDPAVRANAIKTVNGTFNGNTAVKPVMVNSGYIHQYPLAYIHRGLNPLQVTQGMIENVVGTTECPFVTGVVTSVTTDALLTQWNDQFTTWFNAMKDQLTNDAAGNLQAQVDLKLAITSRASQAEIIARTITNKYITPGDLPPNIPNVAPTVSNNLLVANGSQWNSVGLPVLLPKASAVDFNTGTDDTKYVTVKAINDSNNVPNVVPSTSGNFLQSNGTKWVSVAPLKLDGLAAPTDVTTLNASTSAHGLAPKVSTPASYNQWAYLTAAPGDTSWVARTGREVIAGYRTYYVRTDGNNSNNGLNSGTTGAFQTIQKAVDVACSLDLNGYAVTIMVADGTYTGTVVLKPTTGGGYVDIIGNLTTPTNCVISTTSAHCFTNTTYCGSWNIKGFKLQTTTTGSAFCFIAPIKVTVEKLNFGNCASYHFDLSNGPIVYVSIGGYTVSGTCQIHWLLSVNSIMIANAAPITFTTNTTNIGIWAYATKCSIIYAVGMTFTNKAYALGTYYVVNQNSVIDTTAGGATYFPGNAAGSSATGGQYV
jgi:hypothetical protein